MSTSSEPVLANRIITEDTPVQIPDPPKTYTYYHAGPLFSIGDLRTNVQLSSAIRRLSGGKFQPVLPQDLEQRDTTPHSIRDQDIKALLSCDLALFTYDGSELDSGTVVEYMVAKFADMPAVILRTDFRGGGDQGAHKGDPWNLMSSCWPRTVGVVIDSMMEYKTGLGPGLADQSMESAGDISIINQRAGDRLIEVSAQRVVEAFDEVLPKPSRLPKELRESVYQWLALMPGFKHGGDIENVAEMVSLLKGKETKGLL